MKLPIVARIAATAAGVLALVAFVPAASAGGVNQSDVAKLTAYVQDNGLSCMGCHGIDTKLVGPAWTDVAKKYQGNPKAPSELAKRIADGGSGVWGQVPMPSGLATPAQAKELAGMILALDPCAKEKR